MPVEHISEVYLGKIEKIYPPPMEEKTKRGVGGMPKTSFD